MKLVLVVGITCIICMFFFSSCFDNYQSPKYVKLAGEITASTGKKLQVEKALHLIGTGGAMMHDIQMMMMAFQFYEEVDIETAKELLVYSAEKYLSIINSNEEIRPYLHNYPFTAENIEIEIYFRKPDHHNVSMGKLSVAVLGQGKINYYTKCPKNRSLECIYRETYQDALKAIFSSKKSRIKVE